MNIDMYKRGRVEMVYYLNKKNLLCRPHNFHIWAIVMILLFHINYEKHRVTTCNLNVFERV